MPKSQVVIAIEAVGAAVDRLARRFDARLKKQEAATEALRTAVEVHVLGHQPELDTEAEGDTPPEALPDTEKGE